jgi:hypothetical protein
MERKPDQGGDDEELASWLKEVGKRVAARSRTPAADHADIGVYARTGSPARPTLPPWRRILLLGVLLVASLQYVYVDTMVKINSLRSVIVFVPIDIPDRPRTAR